jgi:hypothetical protein
MNVDPDAEVDAHPDSSESEQRTWDIVLESPTEMFLISPSAIVEQGDGARYKIFRIVEGGPILPEPTVKREGKSPSAVTPAEPPPDAKPPPPTWSTPPAESDRTPTAESMQKIPTATKQSEPNTKAVTRPPRAKSTAHVLSSDRGQEHIHFSADRISIEGLDVGSGVNEINVKRWRRASLEEFVITS